MGSVCITIFFILLIICIVYKIIAIYIESQNHIHKYYLHILLLDFDLVKINGRQKMHTAYHIICPDTFRDESNGWVGGLGFGLGGVGWCGVVGLWGGGCG